MDRQTAASTVAGRTVHSSLRGACVAIFQSLNWNGSVTGREVLHELRAVGQLFHAVRLTCSACFFCMTEDAGELRLPCGSIRHAVYS